MKNIHVVVQVGTKVLVILEDLVLEDIEKEGL